MGLDDTQVTILLSFLVALVNNFNSFHHCHDSALLILSPPANTLSYDVTMYAVHFWGQGRSNLPDQRVPYLWLKDRGREKGIWALAIGWNMDLQGIFRFARIQTEGAAYSTFQFCSSVPIRHTNLYLSVCFTTPIFKRLSVSLLLYNSGFSFTPNIFSAPNIIGLKYN